MTLGAYAARWVATRAAHLAPNSRRAYESALRLHVLPALGHLELTTLRPATIRDFLHGELASRPRNSVRADHTALSTVLADAVLDEALGANVAHGAARRLWGGRGDAQTKALTTDQLAGLVHAADLDRCRWLGTFVRVAARSGLRLGELLALEPRDLLPGPTAIRVERTYHGAGRFGPPKGRRARLVEISPIVLALLTARAARDAPYLFTGQRGRPLNPSLVQRCMRRAIARAGLPASFTAHSLRHTYASQLLAAGAPPQWVRHQLGHGSYAITVDLYGSWLPASRPDLAALLDRAEPTRHPPRPAQVATVVPLRRRG